MESEEISATIVDHKEEELDTWALVEIFGHSKCAGRVTTRKFGSEIMIQVDVPKGDTGYSHSELYGPKSIFAIKPTTEAWCRQWANTAMKHGYSPLPYVPVERQIAETSAIEAQDDQEDEYAD